MLWQDIKNLSVKAAMLHKLGLVLFRTLLLFAFLLLQYTLWLSDANVAKWYDLKVRIRQERQAVKHINDKNTQLQGLVNNLKKGGALTKHYAREKMYMIGEGEVLYQFTD